LQFSSKQIFFQSWCGITRPEAAIDSLISDNHSPDQYRVNIVLGNQNEFLKAFNCPSESDMYPQHQCQVW
uniref:Peptidase_M13 domain-containing protein n=1 Tax=Gongylonema pulchrum TaxID=637853 RepID=A0A183CUD0_9BILA